MITSAVVFDHRGRTKRGKEGPVEVRVTISRKVYYIATGVKVRSDEFVGGTIVNRVDAPELNERLVIMLRKVEREINVLLASGAEIDVSVIRQRVSASSSNINAVHEIEEWISRQLPFMGLTPGTQRRYHTLLNRMAEYGMFGRFSMLTAEELLKWDAWLKQREVRLSTAQRMSGKESHKVGDGCVWNYHKCLKASLNRAVDMGVIESNPYDKLRGRFKRGDKENIEYLTEEEMQKIMTVELDEGSQLCLARDLFVMQMFTGMAYGDLMSFDINDYRKIEGKWVARSERIKTGVPYVNVLLPPVIEVLERYGMRVPYMYNHKYNALLKVVASASGVNVRLHSHLARHTFGTYMLRNGVKIENLSKMMGHTKITMTQRYAKVLAQSVRDEFDMIESKINKNFPSHT